MKLRVESCIPGYRGALLLGVEGHHTLMEVIDRFCDRLGQLPLCEDSYVVSLPRVNPADGSLVPLDPARVGVILSTEAEIHQLSLADGDTVYLSSAQESINPQRPPPVGAGLLSKAASSSSPLTAFVMRSSTPTLLLIAGVLCALFAVLFLVIGGLDHSGWQPPAAALTDYGLVVDCGSSSTKVYLYQWRRRASENDTIVADEMELCKVAGPPLADYLDSPSAAAAAAAPILHCLQTVSDNNDIRPENVSVFLGATSSMRIQNESRPESVWDLLSGLQTELAGGGFPLTLPPVVLTGQQEAVFGWVGANFAKPPAAAAAAELGSGGARGGGGRRRVRRELSSVPTLDSLTGSLEMGAGSAQIAFPYNSSLDMAPEQNASVTLYGHTYQLYADSLDCFGIRMFKARFLFHLWQTASNRSANLTSSCFYRDLVLTVSTDDLRKYLCHAPDDIPSDESITVTGTGDYGQCAEEIGRVLERESCQCSHCGPEGVCQPQITSSQTFVALGNYFDIASMLNMSGPGSSFSGYQRNASAVCRLPWAEAAALIPSPKIEYVMDLCFDAVYHFLLLTELGYGLDEQSWNIDFTETISSEAVTWTRGFVLTLSDEFPWGFPPRPASPYAHRTLFLVLSGALFLLSLAFLAYCHMQRRANTAAAQMSYQEFE